MNTLPHRVKPAVEPRELAAAIAITRFGLGARPGELEQARADPVDYLLRQIDAAKVGMPRANAPDSGERLADLRAFQQLRRTARMEGDLKSDPVKAAQMGLREDAEGDFLARFRLATLTEAGFAERWSLFWANHFTVSAVKGDVALLVGPFEQEAIRPHVFGRFEDMLAASSAHPAMLLYLDQAQSIGPTSLAAQRAGKNGRAPGLNENLAREIMELHTVGVDAGYTQADVTEFARALTGWSLGRPDHPEEPQGFMFRPYAHEPGQRLIMRRRYAEAGQAQARTVLTDLAANPHTAKHLAGKIARHFVSDDPSPALVERLRRAFADSDGRLDAVARALVTAQEAWAPAPAKLKTPYEFLVSSWRAVDLAPSDLGALGNVMATLGQKPFSAPSPKGWPEEAAAWCAPDAIVKRMAWSEAFAGQTVGQRDPVQLAKSTLGARLSPAAAQTIARAETRAEGLAILLMTPEFQRR
jgi:uncharacterized protein (DUF1800 family)